MRPTVILDTNSMFGAKAFTSPDIVRLLALTEAEYLRLVIPEVVLHELARHMDEGFSKKTDKAQAAIATFNSALKEIGSLHSVEATPIAFVQPAVGRSVFYNETVKLLRQKKVQIQPLPKVSLAEVMERDLDARKPFTRDGKGFRDALIWESIREVCSASEHSGLKALFVTSNSKDFCNEQGDRLHEDLVAELPDGYELETVANLQALLAHKDVSPLVGTLRSTKSFTPSLLSRLVDQAAADLFAQSVDSVLEVYIGSGMTELPIGLGLENALFDVIVPDDSTINYNVYRVGDNEFSITVSVEADCWFEGYVDSITALSLDDSAFSRARDWSDHYIQVMEEKRLRLWFSGTFTEETREEVELSLDTAEDL